MTQSEQPARCPLPKPLYRIQPLRAYLDTGALILTPNRRIAAKIKQAYSLEQARPCLQPAIYALEDWLQQLYQQLSNHNYLNKQQLKEQSTQHWPLVASNNEISLLWQQCAEQLDHGLLMPATQLARQFASADKLLQEWLLSSHHLPNDADSQLLKQASSLFEQKLQQQQLTTPARAYRHLLQCWQQTDSATDFLTTTGNLAIANLQSPGSDQALTQIVLAEFSATMTPLQQHLLEHISRCCGAALIHLEASDSNTLATGNIQGYQCPASDEAQEILTAALWAKQILEQQPIDQAITLGIVIPELNQKRVLVERIFLQVFEPQHLLPSVARYAAPFNISAGEPLAQAAPIHSALALLRLNQEQLELNHLCTILQSPFWGDFFNSSEERQLRIQAEKILRKPEVFIHSFTSLLQACDDENNILSKRLNDFRNEQARTSQRKNLKQSTRQWYSLFQQQLQLLGWPGNRRLDSIEYQQVKLWQQVLEEFITLHDITGLITCTEALALLQQLATNTVFQAKTPDSPIQILGQLEASGLYFDKLWLCGMSSLNWPPAPRPHPLLPLALQIEQGMPHSSVERERKVAEQLSNSFYQHCNELWVSWLNCVEESTVNISALFAHFKPYALEHVDLQHFYYRECLRQMPPSALEYYQDQLGLPLTAQNIAGGQANLKMAADNLFDAYVRYRLKLDVLREPQPGIPKSLRGVIVHSCLEAIWRKLKSQQALLALSDSDLKSLIEKIVTQELNRNNHPALNNYLLHKTEALQICTLLENWLQLEKQRSPFTVVGFEEKITLTLAGKTLSLRIDRIDQLQDNSLLIIDYKTSAAQLSANLWKDEPPQEPQLPLYTLVENLAEKNTEWTVGGIAFAQANIEKMGFVCLGESPEQPFGNKNQKPLPQADWFALQEQWQQSLNVLAEKIVQGELDNHYRKGKPPTYATEYLAFNRWHELTQTDTHTETNSSQA